MYNYFRNAISFVRFFLIYAEICWVCAPSRYGTVHGI